MRFVYFTLFVGFVVLNACVSSSQLVDPIPEYDTFTMESGYVHENRVINVWTPAGYKSGIDSLPVMYMADGGIKEDFPHIANTLALLIGQGKINPLILVGIENTQRRKDLTGFTEVSTDKEIAAVVGGSEAFRNFIREELFAEINKRYRTKNERSIIGESLSGLFVMETFFLAPDMFDCYIAFDPSLWWNNHYLVRTASANLSEFTEANKRVWFAGSSATDIFPYTRELATILTAHNSDNIQWLYSDEPKEKHSTIFRATKEKAIIWTLAKKRY